MLNQLDVMELLGCNSEYQLETKTLNSAFEDKESTKQISGKKIRCYITIPSIDALKQVLSSSNCTPDRSVA